jgi:hypothetical protein
MPDTSHDDLLAQLAGQAPAGGLDPWAALAASQPQHAVPERKQDDKEKELDALVEKIKGMTGTAKDVEPAKPAAVTDVSALDREPAPTQAPPAAGGIPDAFYPVEPANLDEAEITPSEVEALILKMMLSRGDCSGREVHQHLKLPFRLIEELLRGLKMDQLVVHRGAAPMNDYVYQLTDLGRERARRMAAHCTYFGAARLLEPVRRCCGKAVAHAAASDRGRPETSIQRLVDQ